MLAVDFHNFSENELIFCAFTLIMCIDINASALSKLEGQLRTVTDIELLAFAEILDVDVFWLLTGKSQQI